MAYVIFMFKPLGRINEKVQYLSKTHFCRDFTYRSVGYKNIFLSTSVRFSLTALTTICLFNPFHTLPVLSQRVVNKKLRMNLVETKNSANFKVYI